MSQGKKPIGVAVLFLLIFMITVGTAVAVQRCVLLEAFTSCT